jgi:glycosyltransferase involved in cell wall biosynthesis
MRLLARRDLKEIKLIIIGVDWMRKGMAKAIQVAGKLRERGLNVHLQIVGCRPPSGFFVPAYVSLFGQVSKHTPEGVRRLEGLLGVSHLLILPTEAECAAVVLAEANAFGVPFISNDVGGNSSLVQQNFNGILLPTEADASTWADAAMGILRDRETYEVFSWQAYDFFHKCLSWTNAVKRFQEAVSDLL